MPDSFLSGVRVIDMTRVISGPVATQILGDFGAEVVKVERPGSGDEARGYVRAMIGDVAVSPLFACLNGGKRSVCVDVSQDDGLRIVHDLVKEADVFIHNFRPGVAGKLGLDEETLMAGHPGLIYCNISGFGETGPLRQKAANDIVGQAYGGLMSLIGEPGGSPVRCPVPIADLVAGYQAAIGILAALIGRLSTGRGAVVATSLVESVVGLMAQYVSDYLVSGQPIGRMGSRNRFGQPNQAFAASDGYLVIAAVNEAMWQRCTEALDAIDLLADPRFQGFGNRVANQDALEREITKYTKNHTVAELVERLEAAGVSCAPINDVAALIEDEQVGRLELMSFVDYAGVKVPVVGSPLRINGERPPTRPVPKLGQDTAAVLETLGYSNGQITALLADRVIG